MKTYDVTVSLDVIGAANKHYRINAKNADHAISQISVIATRDLNADKEFKFKCESENGWCRSKKLCPRFEVGDVELSDYVGESDKRRRLQLLKQAKKFGEAVHSVQAKITFTATMNTYVEFVGNDEIEMDLLVDDEIEQDLGRHILKAYPDGRLSPSNNISIDINEYKVDELGPVKDITEALEREVIDSSV